MHTTATAPEVAKIYFNTIFKDHEISKVILSDHDTKFTSHFQKSFFSQLRTKLAMSTAFHLQTDRQTERLNRTLEDMLRIYATYKQDTWDEYLLATEFTYNNSKQASTGFTLFELDNRQHPITPITLATRAINNTLAISDFINHQNNMIKIAKNILLESQNKQIKYAN